MKGIWKLLARGLPHENAKECLQGVDEIKREQREISSRVDRIRATLNGEDKWFLRIVERKEHA